MFKGQSGFSVDNLYYMKRWYAFFQGSDEILYQAGKKSQMPEMFALIPWRHHVEIVKKCHSVDEAFFYIRKTIDGNWSRSVLEDSLKSKLFQAQGQAITNFQQALPVPQGNLAQEVLKSPYNFEFLTMKKEYARKIFVYAILFACMSYNKGLSCSQNRCYVRVVIVCRTDYVSRRLFIFNYIFQLANSPPARQLPITGVITSKSCRLDYKKQPRIEIASKTTLQTPLHTAHQPSALTAIA